MHEIHQVTPHTQPVAALSNLVDDVVDVIKGFRETKKRAEPDLLPTVERLLSLHKAHAAALLEALDKAGGRPDQAGSVMGLVHQAVATGRDWFGALDSSSEQVLIDGEHRLLESYNTAIEALGETHDLRPMLHDQRDTLKTHVDAISG